MNEILLVFLNVLLVGAGLAVVGLLLVRLLRAFLVDPQLPDDNDRPVS